MIRRLSLATLLITISVLTLWGFTSARLAHDDIATEKLRRQQLEQRLDRTDEALRNANNRLRGLGFEPVPEYPLETPPSTTTTAPPGHSGLAETGAPRRQRPSEDSAAPPRASPSTPPHSPPSTSPSPPPHSSPPSPPPRPRHCLLRIPIVVEVCVGPSSAWLFPVLAVAGVAGHAP